MSRDPAIRPLSFEGFSGHLIHALPGVADLPRLAVAVSGGGDSLALLWLLSRWSASTKGPEIHALTVDHGLRPESGEEARAVQAQISGWPHVVPSVLRWRGEKPKTRVMEAARAARYDLMARYCARRKIKHLFLAHHLDDQAETVLMRILKGTGVDGLSAMVPVQTRGDLVLVRPLLSVSHADLLATLTEAGISWVEDPSNRNSHYLRPRLRAFLATEGLEPGHLALTAARAARARTALDEFADQVWAQQVRAGEQGGFEMPCAAFDSLPEEIQIRVLLRAIVRLGPGRTSPVRLDRVEAAAERLRTAPAAVRLTLGGCLISRGEKMLRLRAETV